MIKKMFIIFVFMLGMVSFAYANQSTAKEVVTPVAPAASAVAQAPVNDSSAVWFNLIFTVVCISSMMGYIGYVLEAQLGNK